ncbi:flagellar basal body L-ring protein FlgH [Palleronia pelagia]|uniref:Flagellar L-ring protein n=1 Tax=Palleronia pelagia TaxID=387096 RepID=A0A1H8F3V3_9RHOB|nr:flagellar basal body L-ring protein FlgH [Palleronia pelagia]SEN26433.1 flagellar L-ring protein precursor FlgH [Palleronia pelagia]
MSPKTPLLLVCLLAGCSAGQHFGRDPHTSDLVLSPQTMPEVARVSVPMPEAVQAPTPVGAARASLFARSTDSLFSDQRADDVGDILTVIISIDDEARLRTASDRERGGSASAGFPTFFGLAGRIAELVPGFDDLPAGEDVIEVGARSSASGEGSIARNEEINLKVAALVVQKLPNGALVVAGRQEVKVNNELRELRMAGIVRPADIRNDNTIPYERIAEARIAYGGRGALSRTQSRGYGEDAMDIVLPY